MHWSRTFRWHQLLPPYDLDQVTLDDLTDYMVFHRNSSLFFFIFQLQVYNCWWEKTVQWLLDETDLLSKSPFISPRDHRNLASSFLIDRLWAWVLWKYSRREFLEFAGFVMCTVFPISIDMFVCSVVQYIQWTWKAAQKLSLKVLLSLSVCDMRTNVKCSDISLGWVNNTGLLST